MSEKPYSEQDVQRLAEAIGRIDVSSVFVRTDGSMTAVPSGSQRLAKAVLEHLAAAGRLSPPPSQRQWIFPMDAKVDALMPDGTHRYWSTHCRHDRHEDCSATTTTGRMPGKGMTWQRAAIERQPAQCKTCSSPCICPCHSTPPTINEESTDG